MSKIVVNCTGVRTGVCLKHGRYSGPTTTSRPHPECPKCKAREEKAEEKNRQKESLKEFIRGLKENPKLAAQIKELLK